MMSRRPLIAGNWKMHLNVKGAEELAKAVLDSSKGLTDRDVMIAPAFTSLGPVSEIVAGSSVILAAQNVCWEPEGPFTGEISPAMLHELGVSMVILGHSERRHVFMEDNKLVNRRLLGSLNSNLASILCIGEKLNEREAGNTFKVLDEQVRQGLSGVKEEQIGNVIIAYEPVWAIGTGKTATKEQAQEAHSFIRGLLSDIYNKNIADSVRILYGGSVKPGNVDNLMAEPDIDGALVGGAALKFESFDRIIHFNS